MFLLNKKLNRMEVFTIIIVLIFIIIASRIAFIQLVNGKDYRAKAEALGEKPIIELSARGEILDRDGKKIAANSINYAVVYSYLGNIKDSNELNNALVSVIDILYKNGEQDKLITDSLPIDYDTSLKGFVYKLATSSKYELVKQAERFKEQNNIETTFDKSFNYDLIQEFSDRLKENDNIEKKDEDIKNFESKYLSHFDENKDAEETLMKLTEKYKLVSIDANGKVLYNYESLAKDAKKFVQAAALRYKLKGSVYKQYEDIEIAKGIKKETAWEIQIKGNELKGISIQVVPMRYYPNGEAGSAFVGYMGRISNSEKYERLGYDISRELIGVSGLEYTLENRENNEYGIQLRGEPGIRYVKIDKYGKIIEETARLEPIPGDSIKTTIDMDIQAAAEKAIDETMLKMREGKFGKELKAQRGAAVVMDIDTGEILALVSRPGFDPNLFAETGTPKDPEIIKKYLLDNPKELNEDKYDSIARPMFNYAAQGAVMPGSTFKPFTAIAGLEEGVITKDTIIYDDGIWDKLPGIKIKGWTYDSNGRGFGAINAAQALKYSSNYFFNEVGYMLGFEKFSEWAEKFGLVREDGKRPSTGIEISELPGSVGTPEEQIRKTAKNAINDIINTINDQKYGGYMIYYGTIEYNEIFSMLLEGKYDEKKLESIGITNKEAKRYIQGKISYVKKFSINRVDVLNMAMGQGYVSLTPVQMAQYLSSILNGGTRYKAHLIKNVLNSDGTVKKEIKPKVLNKIDLKPENIAAVMEGMWMAANEPGGTARAAFGNYSIEVGAKTGTAQPGYGEIMEYRDNYSWFLSFAPYDKPEIAVAIVVYDGGSGSYSANIAKEIYDVYFKDRPEMQDYLSRKAEQEKR